jgi:hypothetical protein
VEFFLEHGVGFLNVTYIAPCFNQHLSVPKKFRHAKNRVFFFLPVIHRVIKCFFSRHRQPEA